MTPRFKVGTNFVHYNQKKRKDVYTITDIHTTTNQSGDVVRIEYKCEHEFCRQVVVTFETDTAIAKSLYYQNLSLPC